MFKDTLNASFEFFLEKISGRFWAFSLQLIVSYIAVAVFTLLITVIIIPLFNQGSLNLDLYSFDGLFNWIRMIDPVWTVTIAIAINGLFNLDSEQKKLSFVDFYNNKSSQFWMELLIAVSILSAVFVIYYKSEFLLSLSDQTPLELLLDNGFENTRNTLSVFLSNWMSYLVMASPIVAIVIVELRERRRNGITLVTPVWKVVITLIILKFILAWLFIDLGICLSFILHSHQVAEMGIRTTAH